VREGNAHILNDSIDVLTSLFAATTTISAFATTHMTLAMMLMGMLLPDRSSCLPAINNNSVAVDGQLKTAVPLKYDLLWAVRCFAAGISKSRNCSRMCFFNKPYINKNFFAALVIPGAQIKQGCSLGCFKVLLKIDVQIVIAESVADVMAGSGEGRCSFHITSQAKCDEGNVTWKSIVVNENES